MNMNDVILAYSEWLDGEGLVRGPDETVDGDTRSHEELVDAFLSDRTWRL